jgi:hypothetical protein
MSIPFSDTTNLSGLVQLYEETIGANPGDVSSNSDALKQFTVQANLAIDNYLLLWASSEGNWQSDDTNHNIGGTYNYPIVTRNIVSGQRDYPFTVDDGGNKIISISKVLILPSATATDYVPITPVDETNTNISSILTSTQTGVPNQYGKLSNSIFLDVIPNYNKSAGIKMIVEREGSYFLTTDTTKVAGVPTYHEYFYKKPAYEYAKRKGLSNVTQLEKDVIDLEGSERLRIIGKIQEFFSRRPKDEVRRLTVNITNCR